MKTILALWFVLCLSAGAALPGPAWLAATVHPSTGFTYLLQENFEGANAGPGGNYDLTDWTSHDNNPNPKYTGTILEGSYSFYSGQDQDAYHLFTASPEVWVYWMGMYTNIVTTAGYQCVAVRLGTTYDSYMTVEDGGGTNQVLVYNGAAHSHTVDGIVTNTVYHFKIHYKNDGTGSIEFSTTGVFCNGVGTGATTNKYVSVTGGANDSPDRLLIGCTLGSSAGIIMDKVRVSTSDPGDNPP